MKIAKTLQEYTHTHTHTGITLIALIIAIVVLLILAGVIINMVLGENGIINKSKTAVGKYENAQKDEEKMMGDIKNYIDNYFNATNTREGEAELKAAVLEMVYPVGSIYIGTTNVNPSTFIGGTWEQYAQGRTLIGEGTNGDYTFTAESTGTTVGATTNPLGEYKHQLSVAEMPSHNHAFTTGGTALVAKSREHGFQTPVRYGFSVAENAGFWSGVNRSASSIASTGNNEAHNNIQPYIVTYMWKRVN